MTIDSLKLTFSLHSLCLLYYVDKPQVKIYDQQLLVDAKFHVN